MVAPISAINEPMISNLSGFFLSTNVPYYEPTKGVGDMLDKILRGCVYHVSKTCTIRVKNRRGQLSLT